MLFYFIYFLKKNLVTLCIFFWEVGRSVNWYIVIRAHMQFFHELGLVSIWKFYFIYEDVALTIIFKDLVIETILCKLPSF